MAVRNVLRGINQRKSINKELKSNDENEENVPSTPKEPKPQSDKQEPCFGELKLKRNVNRFRDPDRRATVANINITSNKVETKNEENPIPPWADLALKRRAQ